MVIKGITTLVSVPLIYAVPERRTPALVSAPDAGAVET
jgi:hypothetical protein